MKKKKSANITFVFLTIIIAVLSMFLIMHTFFSVKNSIVSASDDVACRAYLSLKDNWAANLAMQFSNINKKCKEDKITISSTDKNKIYKTVADESKRCWSRYGKGKLNFLGKYGTSGSWCFVCGRITFKNKNQKKYPLNDFIIWSDKNNVVLKNGTRVPYSKTFNMKYTNATDSDIFKLKNNIQSLMSEKDTQPLVPVLTEQFNFLVDLKNKEINPNQNTYIVYRYDTMNMSDKYTNAMKGAIMSMGASLVIKMFAQQILWTVGTLAICGVSTVAAPITFGTSELICAAMGVKTIGSVAEKGEDIASGVLKARELPGKIADFVKMTNKVNSIKNKFKFFSGSTEDIGRVAIAIKRDKNLEQTSAKLLQIQKDLEAMNIKNINDISVNTLKDENNLKNIHNIFDNSVNINLLTEKNLNILVKKEGYSVDQINKLKEIQTELKQIGYKGLKKSENLKKFKQYLNGIGFIASGIVGADIGSNFNFNSNQYVDIMTEEQYYRLCGTENLN